MALMDQTKLFLLIVLIAFALSLMSGCLQNEEQNGGTNETKFTEAQSREIANQFVLKSSTFEYDGYDLKFMNSSALSCASCWQFNFQFSSRHAGYGNREGKIVAEVITPHTALVKVENGKTTYAVLDGGKYDMLTEEINFTWEGGMMPNPAAVYCIFQGGKGIIYSLPEGDAGYCNFSGMICDEWEYFRSNGTKCVPFEEQSKGNESNSSRLPNPASVYCEEQGGILIMHTDERGTGGYCNISGKICEEWEYFRSNGSTCNSYIKGNELGGFCGWSTYAECAKDSDCITGGCSAQVCQGATEEPVVTTCEYTDCFDSEAYNVKCGCVDSECVWKK